jgi:hypothetical protein
LPVTAICRSEITHAQLCSPLHGTRGARPAENDCAARGYRYRASRRMKKFLLYSGIALLAIVVVAYIATTFFLGSVVKAGVNRIGPQLTRTHVELAEANLSPLSGTGTLRGLEVDNPAGWNPGRAFYLGKVHVAMKPFSIFGDHVIIDEIDIDQAEFSYETKIVSSNIGDLLKNIEAGTASSEPGTKPKAANGQPIRFEVHHFRLTNGKVTVGIGATALPLTMPPIDLTDLGTKEGGITADQLAFAVMRSVTTSVVGATTQAAGQIGKTAGAAALEQARKTGESLKKLFGK